MNDEEEIVVSYGPEKIALSIDKAVAKLFEKDKDDEEDSKDSVTLDKSCLLSKEEVAIIRKAIVNQFKNRAKGTTLADKVSTLVDCVNKLTADLKEMKDTVEGLESTVDKLVKGKIGRSVVDEAPKSAEKRRFTL